VPVRALPGYTHGGFASETRPLNGLGPDFDLVKTATTQIVGSKEWAGPIAACVTRNAAQERAHRALRPHPSGARLVW